MGGGGDAPRRLHFYDLHAEDLDDKPSKSLLTFPGLHSEETEQKFNQRVENIVAAFRDRQRIERRLIEPDEETARALAALVVFQVQRAVEALTPTPPKLTLDQILAGDGEIFETFVSWTMQHEMLLTGSLGAEGAMCFPGLGYFTLPLIDHPPARVVPLSPSTFVLLMDQNANAEHVRQMVAAPHMINAFSMTNGGREHKLVIPPRIVASRKRDEIISWVRSVRELGQKMFNLHGKMSETAGLRGDFVVETGRPTLPRRERPRREKGKKR